MSLPSTGRGWYGLHTDLSTGLPGMSPRPDACQPENTAYQKTYYETITNILVLSVSGG